MILNIYLLGIMSTELEVKYRCDGGWWKFGNRCYRILGNSWVTKANAVDICTRANSQLFVPSNQDEYDAVTEYINNLGPVSTDDNPTPRDIEDVWVGCDDEDVEGTFQCVDGTSFTSSSEWITGYLGGTDYNCVAYFKPSGLEDHSCIIALSQVLCEGNTVNIKGRRAPAAITRSSSYKASSLSNRCLRGYTQKTVNKKSKTRCAAECLKEDYCVSFNFKDGVCDLNYNTRNQVHYSAFQEEEGCSYYEP
ncbi:uncharacterized protein LOC121425349 [Lytechinus variegatus]|uniref:uncharacterized protein LOC121425349 n=1 Tax=Lytechinus variegatus TaxID=7654 RepID=UPI001BB29FF1|nr:uncharacterized protein LOC121425349 [Lytechinus variegatus]